MKQFGLISSICVDEPRTWKGKTFVSFDIDWAHDTVLENCIDIVERSGIPATWFVTHKTPLLERLRANEDFELGIHPNFNQLLDGSKIGGDSAADIVHAIQTIVPEAKAVRSHSLVTSERLIDTFSEAGLTHVSNNFIPQDFGAMSPWSLWCDMTIIPHCWQDNVSMRRNGSIKAPEAANPASISVYDFHPIHIFLNSDSTNTYESARACFHDMSELTNKINKGVYGAADVLADVLGRTQ